MTRKLEYQNIRAEDNEAIFQDNYNRMVDDLNDRLVAFPLKDLNGQILDVTMTAGQEIRVSHFLESVPKYRLILNQTGNGVVTDAKGKDSSGVEKWTDKYVTLKNNGAVSVTITIMLIRE